jgi:hypothetical protein
VVHRALQKVELLFHDFCAQLFQLKKLEKVQHQELPSTPYKQEMDPRRKFELLIEKI